MSERLIDFPTGTSAALITFTQPILLADYVARQRLTFPALTDTDRGVYRAYGLERGATARVWGLRSARRYAQILRADGIGQLRRPTEDPRQLGGDFVVGPDGVLRFGFWGQGPDDRPELDQLIDVVAELFS